MKCAIYQTELWIKLSIKFRLPVTSSTCCFSGSPPPLAKVAEAEVAEAAAEDPLLVPLVRVVLPLVSSIVLTTTHSSLSALPAASEAASAASAKAAASEATASDSSAEQRAAAPASD
jgi:hypothetical protein